MKSFRGGVEKVIGADWLFFEARLLKLPSVGADVSCVPDFLSFLLTIVYYCN